MSLKKFLLVLLAVTLAVPLAAGAGSSAEAAPPSQDAPLRTITVTGFGTAYGAPDIALIGLGVEASNQDIEAALSNTNERMQAVTDALKARGVAAADIRTEHFSIYQDYGYGPMGPEQSESVYRVSNGITITVRDTNLIGELLAAAVDAGANMVNYMQFDIDNRAALESEARKLAVEDAGSRAAELAALVGLTVGEPLTISEGTSYAPQMYGGGGGGDFAAAAPPISQGMLSVSMSVTITYALQ